MTPGRSRVQGKKPYGGVIGVILCPWIIPEKIEIPKGSLPFKEGSEGINVYRESIWWSPLAGVPGV
jgi:hypothetical protein